MSPNVRIRQAISAALAVRNVLIGIAKRMRKDCNSELIDEICCVDGIYVSSR